MFSNIVVGVDGGDGGRDAIALAQRLRFDDGAMTLAHVFPGDAHVWRGASAAYDVAEREAAGHLLERMRKEAGVSAHLQCIGSATPGRGLHELCERTDADLLVIGSSRRGLLGRVMVGDDTRSALDGAPCSVAIAPTGFAAHEAAAGVIGVGYDGSPESEHALTVARTLAEDLGSRLAAFAAVFIPARRYAGPAWPDAASVRELVDQARGRLSALPGIEPHAVYGDPGEELARFSDSLDLLVIGSRGYGPFGRIVHGSVAQHLARTARCPLLVCTRGARRRDAAAAPAESAATGTTGATGAADQPVVA